MAKARRAQTDRAAARQQRRDRGRSRRTAPLRSGAGNRWCGSPSKPGKPAIYWIHGAMGNVVSIKPLADQLGETYPIYGLQAQGIDGKLPPLEKVEDMAMSYVAAIRDVDPEGPYCLLGYSGGGVIGYEMARQLGMDGQSVAVLAMIDTLAPTHAHGASLADWLRFAYREGLDRFAEQIRNSWSLRLNQFTRRFNTQPGEAETVEQLIANSALVFDAYVRAQSYYHTLPYDGDVLLFRAKRGGIPFQLAGPTLGWDDHVGDRVEVVEIDGTHETVIEPPAVHGIGDKLREKMEALERRSAAAAADGSAPGALPASAPTLLAAK
ncbi:MAG: thioesterase domain-containing protein [Hyphomicrobiaceae bacterium]